MTQPESVIRLNDPACIQQAVRYLQQRDRRLARLIDEHGVARMSPWLNQPFSSLIDAVISQQLSVKVADTIAARVRKVASRNGHYSASKLIALDTSVLRGCGLSQSKVNYIQGIALASQKKQIDWTFLARADSDEAIKQLTKLKGVGKWTAEMLLIFSYGHADILSGGDWGLRRGAQILFELDEVPNDTIFWGMAECWRPYRSVASWYLWRAAESGLPKRSASER